ncbi:MAG: hypothetical protein ACLQVI_15235 [Polyangiaceae bacterium]
MTRRATTVSLATLGAAVIWSCSSTTPPSPAPDSGKDLGADSGDCTPPGDAACQIDPQCGCPSGQKCDFGTNADAGAGCMNAGAGASGSLCTTTADCAAGLTCASGVCHPYCSPSDVETTCPTSATGGPTLGLCNQVNVNAAAVPQDSYCFFACTPSPNDCPSGQGCVIDTVEGTNYSDCQVAGSVAPGGSCTTTSSCAAGSTCYTGGEGGSLCLQFCLATSDCANLGASFQCNTTIGLALDGVLYGLCDD